MWDDLQFQNSLVYPVIKKEKSLENIKNRIKCDVLHRNIFCGLFMARNDGHH